MAYTDIKIIYRAGHHNGWPLCHVRLNNQWIDTFEASSDSWACTADLEDGPVTLTIEHWGKNPLIDSSPFDKFIEITSVEINGVICDWLLPEALKTVPPTPWHKQHTITTGDLYLGHNCTLDFAFESPVNAWIKQSTGKPQSAIQGQESTREVLDQAKKFFRIVKRLP